MRIFGIILAGGAGRRMGGRDKAFLPLAGRPLLSHVIDRLEPQVERLALSANGDAGRFAGFSLPVLPDDTPMGPLAGVLAGLRWAAPLGATALLSVPVDGPFLPGDLAPRLCLAAEGGTGLALVESGGRLHPTYALWPVGLADSLQAFLTSGAKPKVMDFTTAHGARAALFHDAAAFANLNSPDDLAQAAALLSQENP